GDAHRLRALLPAHRARHGRLRRRGRRHRLPDHLASRHGESTSPGHADNPTHFAAWPRGHRSMIRRTPLILAIVTLLAIVTSLGTLAAAQGDDLPDSGPAPGAIGQPVAPLAEKRVYDVANLLNDGQE